MKQRPILFLFAIVFSIVIIVLYNFPPYRILSKFKSSNTIQSVVDLYQDDAFERLESIEMFAENINRTEISILAFKEERLLELYAKELDSSKWTLIKKYPFTAYSGKVGPKLKEGDRQIPEGVYAVESLNPNSSYHLSLRVNYPNDFDRRMATKDGRTNLGGDIMIHGKDVTIGCIPVGDEAIEELFILSSKTLSHSIPIILAPRDFRVKENNIEISGIDWEKDLYKSIEIELRKYN